MEKIKKFINKWGIDGIRESLNRKKLRKEMRRELGRGRRTSLHAYEKLNISDEQLLEEYLAARFSSADPKACRSPVFEDASPTPRRPVEGNIKVFAFYLPQFHAIPENDEWWGKGFTEWTNVAKAQPQYLGHQQPQLPSALGFYDLRSVEALRAQVELAKTFGIHAFCFHYYWFGGKRLLETPINNFLQNKDLDIGFCYCWANENWTRRWDGLEGEVLMAQNYCAEDDINFIENLIPDFKDDRYQKIDGKPLLILYRATLLPDCKATIARWKDRVKAAGFPDLYVIAARSFEIVEPEQFGCDAAVEFPPHQINALDITAKMPIVNKAYQGKIYDYAESALRFGSRASANSRLFKTVMPGWDNEARKPGKGYTFHGNTPAYFSQWLQAAAAQTMKHPASERILFVNAWNEWGEGAHLEPDTRNGHAYLNALSRTLAAIDGDSGLEAVAAKCNANFQKRFDTAVFAHFFYDELVADVLDNYLIHTQGIADLFISITGGVSAQSVERLSKKLNNVYIHLTENRGRDVKPFIEMYRIAHAHQYKYGFKIHGKRSPHRNDGNNWRDALISPLLRSESKLLENISILEKNPTIAMLTPEKCLTDLSKPDVNRGNRHWLDFILRSTHHDKHIGSYKFQFPAGTMFGFRMSAMEFLLNEDIFSASNYEQEAGQLDGTFAHAVERTIMVLAKGTDSKILEIN